MKMFAGGLFVLTLVVACPQESSAQPILAMRSESETNVAGSTSIATSRSSFCRGIVASNDCRGSLSAP